MVLLMGKQASIHAIMESDDRVTGVIKHLDDALAELEKMNGSIGVYRTQLSVSSFPSLLPILFAIFRPPSQD